MTDQKTCRKVDTPKGLHIVAQGKRRSRATLGNRAWE